MLKLFRCYGLGGGLWHLSGAVDGVGKHMCVRERSVGLEGGLEFKILAPSSKEVPKALAPAAVSSDSHSDLLFDLQILRGNAYREYAPIAASLLPDGRHSQGPLDTQAWHVLMKSSAGQVVGCSRYRPIRGGFEQLACSKSALAKSPITGPPLKAAFEQQMALAHRRGIQFGEAGAWAIAEDARCSTAAVSIALMSFALAERLGGGLGITTATTRHRSSSILRRLGGAPLGGFPPYYEPMFGCTIEVLQFDINRLEQRFAAKLEELRHELRRTPIICPAEVPHAVEQSPARGFSIPAYLPSPMPAVPVLAGAVG